MTVNNELTSDREQHNPKAVSCHCSTGWMAAEVAQIYPGV